MKEYTRSLCNSCLVVDREAVRANLNAIRASLTPGTLILPVLKRDAYGLGLREMAALTAGQPGVGPLTVSHISEALSLRRAGYGGGLLLLGNPLPAALAEGAAADVTFTVGRTGLLPALAALAEERGQSVKVQLKLDTGLHRVGTAPGEELSALLSELCSAGERIDLTGVYSHFADTASPTLCRRQFELYLRGLEQVKAAGFDPKLRHICDSAASELYPEYHLDAVRLGRRLIMDNPSSPAGNIREAAAWYSCVTDVRRRSAGDALGYGGAYVLPADAEIAIGSGGDCRAAAAHPLLLHGPVLCGRDRAGLRSRGGSHALRPRLSQPGGGAALRRERGLRHHLRSHGPGGADLHRITKTGAGISRSGFFFIILCQAVGAAGSRITEAPPKAQVIWGTKRMVLSIFRSRKADTSSL